MGGEWSLTVGRDGGGCAAELLWAWTTRGAGCVDLRRGAALTLGGVLLEEVRKSSSRSAITSSGSARSGLARPGRLPGRPVAVESGAVGHPLAQSAPGVGEVVVPRAGAEGGASGW